MTKVIPILFVLGFIWAALLSLGLGFLFLRVTISHYQWRPNLWLSLLVLSGFCVWFGWGWHCLTGRFPFVSARTFWSISLIVHLVWLVGLWDLVLLNSIWTVPNVIVAFVGLLPESGGNGWKHKVDVLATYGIPLAWVVVAVVAYAEDIPSHLGAANYWPLVVVVIALLVTAWCVPRRSNE
jgi:hypothetical protein